VFRDNSREDGYALLDSRAGGLTEDNIVAFIERSHLGGYPELCLTMARSFVKRRDEARTQKLGVPGEALLRDAVKRLRRFGSFLEFGAMEPVEVQRLADEILDAAMQCLRPGGNRDPARPARQSIAKEL
jgi:hypothetical protein